MESKFIIYNGYDYLAFTHNRNLKENQPEWVGNKELAQKYNSVGEARDAMISHSDFVSRNDCYVLNEDTEQTMYASGGVLTRSDIAAKVEERLNEKQKTKEFKDVGERVRGSKKETRAYSIITSGDLIELEQDAITAFKLVTKDRVYPEVNVAEEKAAGVSSGATYIKVKLREACPTKPPNDERKRRSFISIIEYITNELKSVKTYEEFYEFADRIRSPKAPVIIKMFFSEQAETFTDDQSEEILKRLSNKYRFSSTYSAMSRLLKEVMGARFQNFLYRDGDAAKDAYAEARGYDPVSKEQEIKNVASYLETRQNQIRVNGEKIEEYKNYSLDELKRKYYDWRGMDRYRKDMEGFRVAVIQYMEKRITDTKAEMNIIPKRLLARENDWTWFESETQRKKAVKSGERKINTFTPLSYIKRTGGLVIKEEYVEQARNTNPEENPITRDLGFRTVQFGNALKDVRAKEHIRHFLGAITDMAEILDIDIRQLNGIGGLSMAFAARGSAGAAAHYEPGRAIINLTNHNGDGSIAHEFAHYIDNAIVIKEKNEARLSFATANMGLVQSPWIISSLGNIINFIKHGQKGITPSVVKTFMAIPVGVSYFYKKKEYKQRSKPTYYDRVLKQFVPVEILETIEATIEKVRANSRVLDFDYSNPEIQISILGYIINKFDLTMYDVPFDNINQSAFYFYSSKMTSKYWIDPVEMFARAWECFIFDSLDSKGRMNNYLVSGSDFSMPYLCAEGETYVYPFGEERKHLYSLFNTFVEAIKASYDLKRFVPFTNIRQDEYVAIEQNAEDGMYLMDESVNID